MFSDVIECYEAMGKTLASSARAPWTRILVDATLDGSRVDAVVSYWNGEAEKPAGYLTGVPMLARYVYELARIVGNEEKGFFKKCHFDLRGDGKFNVDFEY
ncbi:hypothetical protein [Dyella acidisoli]|uniref:Uncharacterized protein n=1 Tax=Dyella acidisoli TaxID=1867834 RepID=A0ABQ5XUL1_9GAMM|nr:hypothetical protein [Dyella acidisoli]GLQ94191.1 hypothetical protein GCM10007901_31420 [Dyella acidisoli]